MEAGAGEVSGRTLQRHFLRLGPNVRPDGRPPDAYGRFEAGEFGELWTGDGQRARLGRIAYRHLPIAPSSASINLCYAVTCQAMLTCDGAR